MVFNGSKFEWIRYVADAAPDYQYTGPNQTSIAKKNNLKDLGVQLSCDLKFSLQIQKAVSSASQMLG